MRPVRFAQARVAEAARAGFTHVILPKRNLKGLAAPKGVELHGVGTVAEALLFLSDPPEGAYEED